MQRIAPDPAVDNATDFQDERSLLHLTTKTKALHILRKNRAYISQICVALILIFFFWPNRWSYREVLGPHAGPDKYANRGFYQNAFPNPVPLDDITIGSVPSETYIPTLHISCVLYDVDHLAIQIRDDERPRYEIPFEDPYPHPKNPSFPDLKDSNFDVVVETDPFKLQIMRRSTGEIIFDLHKKFIYTDLYIEFTFSIPTNELYGFGERFGPLQMHNGTYSLFILDRSGRIEDGTPGHNSQGHHPMYLTKEKSGFYHVMFFRNANMQEITIKEKELIWQTVGGIIDLNFFLADTPEAALEKYHTYLGGWVIPALWHLGSHQCKWWGYIDNAHVLDILGGYADNGIPLDGMWVDIDIFSKSINFLVDTYNFTTAELFQIYQDSRKKFVTVVQAYIPLQEESHGWNYPNAIDLTMKDGLNPSEPYLGYALSGEVYMIDFQNPASEPFWFTMLDDLAQYTPLAGVWVDANEPTDLYEWYVTKYSANRKYFNLPFYPAGQNFYDGEHMVMVGLDALHYDGSEEYNVRAFNCFHQSIMTYNYFKDRNCSMPFVLTRASVFGIGKYAYHFVPDVESNWPSMRVALSSIMNINILGIAMIGADICGMGGNLKTPPELCARWYQSAAFYPFARNHHSPLKASDNFQEPFRYYGKYLRAIKTSVLLRYSLLKQFQALFFKKKGVGTIFRPIFLEFWNDTSIPPFGSKVYEEQVMIGSMIMTAPCLYEGETTVNPFFPKARWFDLRDNKEIPVRGDFYNLSAKLEEQVPYFLRGGYIIFKQDVTDVLVSDDLSNTFQLVVALGDLTQKGNIKQGKSDGFLLDILTTDENVVNRTCIEHDCMLTAVMIYEEDFQNGSVQMTLGIQSKSEQEELERLKINQIEVLGASSDLSQNLKVLTCQGCPSNNSLNVEYSQGVFKLNFGELPLTHGVSYRFSISSA